MAICTQILIALLMIISTPFWSFSAELIHTIQIGSHQVEHRAQRQYGAVLNVLHEEERGYLRIESIGNYYALRIGKFLTFPDAAGLLEKIKTHYPGARMMTVYISNNRLVEMYQPALVAAPVSVPIALPEELAIISPGEQVVPPPAEIEEQVLAALELAGDPTPLPAETGIQPEQVEAAVPALDNLVAQEEQVVADESAVTVLVQQEEPVVLQEAETRVVPQAEVETFPAARPVEISALKAVVDVASPAASVSEVVKLGAEPVDETVSPIDDLRSLIIVVAAVIFGVLIFSVRALRKGKTAPHKSDAAKDGLIAATAVATEEPSAGKVETEDAFDSEAQDVPEAEKPLPRYSVAAVETVVEQDVAAVQADDDRFVAIEVESSVETAVGCSEEQNDSLVSVLRGLRGGTTSAVERSVERTEPGETALVALPVAESAEKKEAKPVTEERQNRVSRAMEEAMLGRDNGK